MPTSELFKEGLSLIPSPIYPTTLPFSFRSLTILAFWIGESLANIFVLFKILKTAISCNLSSSLPKTIFFDFIPTLVHIHLVTSALSPVRTITRMPALFSFSIDDLALSFGGSKKPIKPINTIFFSRLTSKLSTLFISFFWQTAITRKPASFIFLLIFLMLSLISFVIGETWPL